MLCWLGHVLCSELIQCRRPSAGPLCGFLVIALQRAHVLALNKAQILRLNKPDVLALNKAYVLRLNIKICPVFRANAKDWAFGHLHKGLGRLRPRPPLVVSSVLAVRTLGI